MHSSHLQKEASSLSTQIEDDPSSTRNFVRQPKYVSKFKCIGSDCEDSCCQGATVVIDKGTFDKYRKCEDRQLRVIMDEAVVPNPSSVHDATFAFVAGSDQVCAFLNERRLCAIQDKLGEDYLSRTCDTYPRAINVIDGRVNRTLYMSCPEAARLALLDPDSMAVETVDSMPQRFGDFPSVNTSDSAFSAKPYSHLKDIQEFSINLIKNRDYALWERLVILGMFTEQLSSMSGADAESKIADHIASYDSHVANGLFRPALDGVASHPALQLNFTISALEHRLTSHTMSERFMNCYQEFMNGIGYTSESIDEPEKLYVNAYQLYYKPFFTQHEHMLENYLINSMLTSLFPLGPQKGVYLEERSVFEYYLVLVINYSLIRSMLVGTASYCKRSFAVSDVIRLIQSYVKAVEHNPAYIKQILKSVRDNSMDKMAIVAVLLKD